MENKEYLSEEEYQRINRKVNLIGKILLCVGGIGFITCSILLFGNLVSFEASSIIGFLWVMCAACCGFGLMFFMRANSRKISAYMAQQAMPIAKESIEKMAPSASVAAKEIAKSVKEGLTEENDKK